MIPAGLVAYCVLVVSIGMVGIAVAGAFWVLTKFLEEQRNGK
tara:strand:- start:159 stop:284 length:126 start_codon:yes stop_codon:yes gene_type:complete